MSRLVPRLERVHHTLHTAHVIQALTLYLRWCGVPPCGQRRKLYNYPQKYSRPGQDSDTNIV